MSHIDALLSLLDDPDPRVQDPLASRLASDTELLDHVWERAASRGVPSNTLVDLVLRADAEAMVDAFAEADDLESGVWLLSKLDQPRRDHRTPGSAALDDLAARLQAQTGAPHAGAVATYLGHDCGFAGARRDYDHPHHSFMPRILETRVGLPISLTALWLLVSRRLGIECEAIALPGHVLGRWRGGYVDLFDAGRIVTRDELDVRLRAAGEPSAFTYLASASDRALLKRMARNLVHAYAKRSDQLRATIAHGMATA